MGEIGQPQERGDQPVVDPGLRALDPSDPGDNGKQVSQEEIGGVIAPVMVRGPRDVMLEEVPQVKRVAKLSKKEKTTIPSQTTPLE